LSRLTRWDAAELLLTAERKLAKAAHAEKDATALYAARMIEAVRRGLFKTFHDDETSDAARDKWAADFRKVLRDQSREILNFLEIESHHHPAKIQRLEALVELITPNVAAFEDRASAPTVNELMEILEMYGALEKIGAKDTSGWSERIGRMIRRRPAATPDFARALVNAAAKAAGDPDPFGAKRKKKSRKTARDEKRRKRAKVRRDIS
jgi:hypothetical protein